MNSEREPVNNLASISCDRFNRCSANICPLDPEWHKRKHLNGERICFYLLEAQKTNAKAVFECGGRGCLYAVMQEATPAIYSTVFGSNAFAGTSTPAPIARSAALRRYVCPGVAKFAPPDAADVNALATEAALIPALLHIIGYATVIGEDGIFGA